MEEAEEDEACEGDLDFHKAIHGVIEAAPPAGSRHARYFEKIKVAINALDETMTTGMWSHGLGIVIVSYLLDEAEGANVMKEMMQERTAPSATREIMMEIEGEEEPGAWESEDEEVD